MRAGVHACACVCVLPVYNSPATDPDPGCGVSVITDSEETLGEKQHKHTVRTVRTHTHTQSCVH